MSKKSAVPDAWDDEWEAAVDKQDDALQEGKPAEEAKISKAERRAKHAELNKKLWDSAENTERMHFLEAQDVPLKSAFKPGVTVLSRKPPPKLLSRDGATSGMAGLRLDDDEDSEEEARKKNEQAFAERQAKAQREREEKQRKYKEVREKLFGASPSDENQRRASPTRPSRGKGKGRGGRDSQPSSGNDQSPARGGNQRKQLYDPEYTVKPNSTYIQKREATDNRPETPNQNQPIREPRGPNVSGRGGNGFAPRGNRTGSAV